MREKEEFSYDHSVIDLFCGIGGLSHGFKKENFNVIAGYDIDDSCKYAFEANNGSPFFKKDISELTGDELKNRFKKAKVKILVGCAPCQPFSSYSYKENDYSKWSLLYHFSRLVKEIQPEIISMENVAQLINFKKAPVFQDFLIDLKASGYNISYEIVNCSSYGIPQNRKRLVLLASKFGPIKLIDKTHTPENFVTVKDVIAHLPKINDGQSDTSDPLHCSRRLTPINKLRIQNTPAGGSWKDWPNELILSCHKKKSGKTYASVYGRMRWNEPAPTITTQFIGYGNGRFGHPDQDRAISLREAALFQTFPMSYEFVNPNVRFSVARLAKHLGNAVPVLLAQVIAKSIRNHLKKFTL